MSDLRTYRVLNMNAPSANTEEASNIALACENFIRKMGFKNYEYQCDSTRMAEIHIFNNLKQKIGSYAVMEAVK